MNEEIFGISEDPWPYEYVVNALLYFSMSVEDLHKYIVSDFPDTLFHGNLGDWTSGDAIDTITTIYTEVLIAGCSIDEWLEDESLNMDTLQSRFRELYELLHDKEMNTLLADWSKTSALSAQLLLDLAWDEISAGPMISCEYLLNEWSYGAYSENCNRA